MRVWRRASRRTGSNAHEPHGGVALAAHEIAEGRRAPTTGAVRPSGVEPASAKKSTRCPGAMPLRATSRTAPLSPVTHAQVTQVVTEGDACGIESDEQASVRAACSQSAWVTVLAKPTGAMNAPSRGTSAQMKRSRSAASLSPTRDRSREASVLLLRSTSAAGAHTDEGSDSECCQRVGARISAGAAAAAACAIARVARVGGPCRSRASARSASAGCGPAAERGRAGSGSARRAPR